ncbi:hypothetical protein JCM19232_844 [Vibrio ishigakensis]|uniref:Uncharacterized protein n=1 Tax=Vibrio ishigakensis TaxID=1481914 RepID=A0A0B8P2R5_9VIBR|nr:hypothetical protein JCM19232_844 [Vibrio ishigakensis]
MGAAGSGAGQVFEARMPKPSLQGSIYGGLPCITGRVSTRI